MHKAHTRLGKAACGASGLIKLYKGLYANGRRKASHLQFHPEPKRGPRGCRCAKRCAAASASHRTVCCASPTENTMRTPQTSHTTRRERCFRLLRRRRRPSPRSEPLRSIVKLLLMRASVSGGLAPPILLVVHMTRLVVLSTCRAPIRQIHPCIGAPTAV